MFPRCRTYPNASRDVGHGYRYASSTLLHAHIQAREATRNRSPELVYLSSIGRASGDNLEMLKWA